MRKSTPIIATLLLTAAAGCSGAIPTADAEPELTSPLEAARETCRPEGGTNQDHVQVYYRHVALTDDGAGLSLHSEGEESEGASIVDILCVLHELDVPGAVIARMENTRALDGTQDATWGGLKAWWSYHPNSGFNMVIEQE